MSLPPNKTKIVCTIGPASESPKVLERMVHAGMNVARLNLSHGDVDGHRRRIEIAGVGLLFGTIQQRHPVDSGCALRTREFVRGLAVEPGKAIQGTVQKIPNGPAQVLDLLVPIVRPGLGCQL